MSIEQDVAALRRDHNGLAKVVGDLQGHVEKNINPAVGALEGDMREIRALLGGTATKTDILDLRKVIDQGNQNMAAALAAVPADQAKSSYNLGVISAVAMSITGIAAIGGIIYAILNH